MNRFIILLAVAALTSCAPAAVLQGYQKDSVVTVIRDSVVFRDSVIYVRVEAENDSAVLLDSDTSRLSTRYATSEAYVSCGRLHHSLRNKSEALVPVEIKMPVVFHTEASSLIRERKAVETVEVEKQLSRWQMFIQMIGYCALGLLAGWMAVKLSKILR